MQKGDWHLPPELFSYEEWLSEKFGQHYVPSGRIANMSRLREIYEKMRFDEIWNIVQKVSL